jgi:hypothetical protein
MILIIKKFYLLKNLMLTNIKEYTQLLLEKLITEKAISISDINNSNFILIKEQTTKEVKLVLYNIEEQSVYGYIYATKADKTTFQVEKSAAKKGYGPLMYDCLMMSINPLALKPSYLIKQGAQTLWKYYLTRSDVKSEVIDFNDIVYSNEYKEDQDDINTLTNKDVLDVINRRYYIKPTRDYFNLIQISDSLIKEFKLNKRELFKQGLDYFWDMYELPLNI